METEKNIANEVFKAFFKALPILVTATASVFLKMVVISKTKKVTFTGAFISWLGAIAICYICYPVVTDYFSESYVPAILTFCVLTGDKFTIYLVEKFNAEIAVKALISLVAEKFGFQKIEDNDKTE